MKTSSSIGLDTNILVYAYNQKSPQHQIALNIIKDSRTNPGKYVITPQNATELYATLTKSRPFQIPPQEAKIHLLSYLFSRQLTLLVPNAKTIFYFEKIIDQVKLKPGTHIYDLFLAATLLSHNIHTLYTQNTKDFQDIKDFNPINPFT